MAKLGKNFRTDTFAKNGDLYPAKTLLVGNLNKMIDKTGKYSWYINANKDVPFKGGDDSLKHDSGKITFTRTGAYVSMTLTVTFKEIYATTTWGLIHLDDFVPDEYSPMGSTASYISNVTIDSAFAVIVSDGDIIIGMPSKKGVERKVSVTMRWMGGPVLVSKSSNTEHLNMSDKVSTSRINAIFDEFSKSSAKIPARPGAIASSIDNYTIGSSDAINSATMRFAKSVMGTSMDGTADLKPNTGTKTYTLQGQLGPNDRYKHDGDVPVNAIFRKTTPPTGTSTAPTVALYVTTGTLDATNKLTVNATDSYLQDSKDTKSNYALTYTTRY